MHLGSDILAGFGLHLFGPCLLVSQVSHNMHNQPPTFNLPAKGKWKICHKLMNASEQIGQCSFLSGFTVMQCALIQASDYEQMLPWQSAQESIGEIN